MDGTGYAFILQVGKSLVYSGRIGGAGSLDGLEQHHTGIIAQCRKGRRIAAISLSVPGYEILYLGIGIGRGEVIGEDYAFHCALVVLIQSTEHAVPAIRTQELGIQSHFLGLDCDQGVGVVVRGHIQGIRISRGDLGKLALEVGIGALEALEGYDLQAVGFCLCLEGFRYAQGVVIGDVVEHGYLLGRQLICGIICHGLGLGGIQEAGTEYIAACLGDGSGCAGGGHHGQIVLGGLGRYTDRRLTGDSAPQSYHAIAL